LIETLRQQIKGKEDWVADLNRETATISNREQRLHEAEGHLQFWQGKIREELSPRARQHLVSVFLNRITVCQDDEGVFYDYNYCFNRTSPPLEMATLEPALAGSNGGEVRGCTLAPNT
jgi:hypothetical protein